MSILKINTYTDESGQDTKGKTFIVATIIISSENIDQLENLLSVIEKESKKNKKWYNSGNQKRHKYISLLLKKQIFSSLHIYYSIYKNKQDYIKLVVSHISKVIITHTKNQSYSSKIFLDKVDKRTMLKISQEIKLFRVKYKKIRGLTEESNIFIRLSDAVCGLLRDMKNKNIPNDYRLFFAKLFEV